MIVVWETTPGMAWDMNAITLAGRALNAEGAGGVWGEMAVLPSAMRPGKAGRGDGAARADA